MSIGMVLNYFRPILSIKFEKTVKIFSALFLFALIVFAMISQGVLLKDYWRFIGSIALLINLLTLAIAYSIPTLIGISKEHAIAITMEAGIHNGTLAIYIALNVLNLFEASIPAALYSIVMFITAASFGFFIKK
jgi:BASS family bile acid:Na+ symporter